MRLFLSMIGTPLQSVLGYPFLHQFNTLINLKHRTVEIVHNWTTYIIPVVKPYGNPHTPMSVYIAYGDLQAVQSAAEPRQQLPPTPQQHVMAQKALLVKLLFDAAVLSKKDTINSAG